jgi:hypothetical protein
VEETGACHFSPVIRVVWGFRQYASTQKLPRLTLYNLMVSTYTASFNTKKSAICPHKVITQYMPGNMLKENHPVFSYKSARWRSG